MTAIFLDKVKVGPRDEVHAEGFKIERSAALLVLDTRGRILLSLRDMFRRDNGMPLAYGGQLDYPGGACHLNEPALECIQREIKEEMGIELEEAELSVFKEYPWLNEEGEIIKIETIFLWKKTQDDLDQITPTEGQGLNYYTTEVLLEKIAKRELAYNNNETIAEFILFNLIRTLVDAEVELPDNKSLEDISTMKRQELIEFTESIKLNDLIGPVGAALKRQFEMALQGIKAGAEYS